MSRRDKRPEQRLRRWTDQVEKGLARGRLDFVLSGLAELPAPARAPYLDAARQLLVRQVAGAQRSDAGEQLVVWARQLRHAGLLGTQPDVVAAGWACLWSLWLHTPSEADRKMMSDLFDELWPALIDRYPAIVAATEALLGLGEATEPVRAALREMDVQEPSAEASAARWPDCVRAASSAEEARLLVYGVWGMVGSSGMVAAAAALLDTIEQQGEEARPAWMAGASVGMAEVSCLEQLKRFGGSSEPVAGSWFQPVALLCRSLRQVKSVADDLRGDLLLLWRALVKRVAHSDCTPSQSDALAQLGVAILDVSPSDRSWLCGWIESAPPSDLLLPLLRRALELCPQAGLYTRAVHTWQVAKTEAMRPPPWLVTTASRAFQDAADVAGWLRRVGRDERRLLIDFVVEWIDRGDSVLDALWQAEPEEHGRLATAYRHLIERMREVPGDLHVRKWQAWKDGDVDLMEYLDTLIDEVEPPLNSTAIALLRRIWSQVLPHDARLLWPACEALDHDTFLKAGEQVVATASRIETCLFAVMVAASGTDWRDVPMSLMTATIDRYGTDPLALATGIAYAVKHGFESWAVERLADALERAADTQARKHPDVKAARAAVRKLRPRGRKPKKKSKARQQAFW